jgi:hypothetical protein
MTNNTMNWLDAIRPSHSSSEALASTYVVTKSLDGLFHVLGGGAGPLTSGAVTDL